MSGVFSGIHRAVAVLALFIAGAALAHEGATGFPAERMKVMADTAAQAKAIDGALKASSPAAAEIRGRAERIHAHAHDMTRMFPPGSRHGPTFAALEIWTKRDDFERLAQAYDAASERLAEAAAAKALPEVRRQFTVVRSQCLECHERFRVSRGRH